MAHHLLLADDSVTIQRVIKLTFADEDVEVVTVGDGNQAVAAIDRQPPDIVLADVAMPGRSGYEVAQHIRMSPRLAHIPVLLLTGAFEPVDEARASEVGCDGVLAKPFEPDVVVSRVKELLARPRSGAPATVLAAVASSGPVPPAPAGTLVAASPAGAPAPLMFPVREQPTAAAVLDAAAPAALVEPAAPARQSPADVDAYFDRLDQAFATLALTPRTSTPAPVESSEPAAAAPTLIDAFAGLATGPATVAPPAAVEPAAAAEPSAWSAAAVAGPSPVTAMPETSDAQIDRIVDRVIEKLTARLGAGLPEVVATVAERLVRDEISQIKKRL